MEIAVLALVVIGAFVLFFSTIKIVPQGFEYTRERLGQFICVMHPGIHFLVPFVDKVGSKVNMMEQVIPIPSQHVISSDNATIRIDAVCYVQVIDSKKSSYEVDDPFEAITQLVSTNFRSVLGSMELDVILSGRETINSKVMAAMDGATGPWGIKVTRCELSECAPSQDLLDAMSAQMKAERNKRAAILEAEGIRSAEIAKAEGERQSKILRAEGERQAAILNAEGERQAAILNAEAREREAKAEAEATKVVSEAIKDGDAAALNYFLGQKYIEGFSEIAKSENSKLIVVPAEMTSLVQTLSGMASVMATKPKA